MPREIHLRAGFGKTTSDKNDLANMWKSGWDFYSPHTRYVSIKDIALLRATYDYIYISAINKTNDALIETLIYTNIMAGITHYV